MHILSRSFLFLGALACSMAAMPAQATRYSLYQESFNITALPGIFLVAAGVTLVADCVCSDREARVLAKAMADAEGMARQDCACQHIRMLKRKKRVAQNYAGAALGLGASCLVFGAYLLYNSSNTSSIDPRCI